jgi:hypothetical protein
MINNAKAGPLLGILGFLVSIIALIISILGYNQTNKQYDERIEFDKEQRKSKLVIQIGRDLQQQNIQFLEYTGPYGYSALFQQRYNLILNNNGFQPASITEWRVVAQSPIFSQENREFLFGWYHGMGPKFYTQNGMEIRPPFTIAPNSPKKIIMEVGVRVPTPAWNSVSHILAFEKEYDYYQAESVFSKRGYPQFGQYMLNSVSQHHNLDVMSYGNGPYHQNFNLYLTKGDGAQVEATFFTNISDAFIQGENSGTSWENVAMPDLR